MGAINNINYTQYSKPEVEKTETTEVENKVENKA